MKGEKARVRLLGERAGWEAPFSLLAVLVLLPLGELVQADDVAKKTAPVPQQRLVFQDGGGRPGRDEGLIAHWPLTGDVGDHSGNGHHATNHGVDLDAPRPDGKRGGAASFDGRGAYLEVPGKRNLRLGKGDFSLAVWVHTERQPEAAGDLFSQYDPAARRGVYLTLKTNYVTFSQANARHLQF